MALVVATTFVCFLLLRAAGADVAGSRYWVASFGLWGVALVALAWSLLAVTPLSPPLPVLVTVSPLLATLGAAAGLLAAYGWRSRSPLAPGAREAAVLLGVAAAGAWAGLLAAALVATVALASATSRLASARRSAGRRLGPYVVEAELGAGAMGVVYRARDLRDGRLAALKVLRGERAPGRASARFEREVRHLARLRHPNIVGLFERGRTPDGQRWYAMELVDGISLEELVDREGPQPADRVAQILDQVAAALGEAHAAGIIHRDIKPANVMLTAAGVAKVLDFGMARDLRSDDDRLTATGAVAGTPLYLSPEAILDPDAVDGRADLYALGAVGYFLLTGGHVFAGKNLVELCAKHTTEVPERPSERLGAPVPAALERVILACLAKAPAGRPGSADELREQLSRFRSPRRATVVRPVSPLPALPLGLPIPRV